MKDLLFYVADADALAFMKSLLNKPQALGIRQITFDIERHPQRDSGMVQSGKELMAAMGLTERMGGERNDRQMEFSGKQMVEV